MRRPFRPPSGDRVRGWNADTRYARAVGQCERDGKPDISLQQRVSTFGLKQVTVEGIGNSEVYVIIPSVSPAEINQTINIIQSQGRFDGVVNGQEAVNGSDILKGSIGQPTPEVLEQHG